MSCFSTKQTADSPNTLRELLVVMVEISAAFPVETRRRQDITAKGIMFSKDSEGQM